MFSSHQRASTHQFQWNKFLKCQCFCFERSYYLFVVVWSTIKITSFWRYSVQEMLSHHLNLTIWARCESFDWFALPVLSSSSKEKCSHWLKMLTKQPFTHSLMTLMTSFTAFTLKWPSYGCQHSWDISPVFDHVNL